MLILAALAVTLAGTVAEFWRQRRSYLDPKAAKTAVRAGAVAP